MVKHTFLSALLLALTLLTGCARDTTPEFVINTRPTLPSVEPLRVVQGFGIIDGTLSIYLYQPRDTVEKVLGRPVDSSQFDWSYQVSDTRYIIDYAGTAPDQYVSSVEVRCERFMTCKIAGSVITWGIAWNATRADMEAKYGAPNRDAGLTWYYDSLGFAFVYDNVSLRIISARVYAPSGGPLSNTAYVVDSVWASNGVDNDGDGYYSQFWAYFRVKNQASASDSMAVILERYLQGDTGWVAINIGTFRLSLATASYYFVISGIGHAAAQYRIQLWDLTTGQRLDTAAFGTYNQEAAAQDVGSVDCFPVKEGNQWDFTYYYYNHTTAVGAPTTTNSGTLSWVIADTQRYAADSLRIIIHQTTRIDHFTFSSSTRPWIDTTYNPPQVTLDTLTLLGSLTGNGLRWQGDSCWVFFHDTASAALPNGMFLLQTDTATVLGVTDTLVGITRNCGAVSKKAPAQVAPGLGPVSYYYYHSNIGATTEESWTLYNTNVNH